MRVIKKASLAPLRNQRIAVIGYGAQGRAQALNLRDSGLVPVVGLPSSSRSRLSAKRDRLKVVTPRMAAYKADCLLILAPDHFHGQLFDEIGPHLRRGQLIAFAHAASVHFGLVKPPRSVDVVLVAPLGPGKRLRELRSARDGMPCFFSVHHDATGTARKRGLALAKAIGCIPPGAIETTFREEAIGDLFGEQAVLCGGLSALLMAGVQTLVKNGHSSANAYLECVYQLDLIIDLIKSEGLRGMFERISPTAAYGAAQAGPKIIGRPSQAAMAQLYKEIASGQFFRNWTGRATRRKTSSLQIPTTFERGETEVAKVLRD